MASVAICPHCFLQLVVPDNVDRDARVVCPTCAKEFGLDQAVLRSIPEVTVVERPVAESAAKTVAEISAIEPASDSADAPPLVTFEDDSEPTLDTVEQADADIAAWFRHGKTVPEVAPVAVTDERAETQAQIEDQPQPEDDETSEPAELMIEPLEQRIQRPSAVTLADLLPPSTKQEDTLSGPSFDLPNVPLRPESGATVEFDEGMPLGSPGNTEFELDDVDFESGPANETIAATSAGDDPDFAGASSAPVVIPKDPPRKRRSVARTLVGTALGGMVGVPLGYFVLLYALGPAGDFLQVAQFIPRAILPASFESRPAYVAAVESAPAPPGDTDLASNEDKSANVPARYVETMDAPDESPASDTSAVDDRLGVEPARIEEPVAEPLDRDATVAAIGPLPLNGPTYTLDQLATALESGERARSGLVTGDLSDATVRRTKGLSYARLCDLAHTLVFLDRTSAADEGQAVKRRTEQLFADTLSDPHTRSEVGRIAAIWIDSPHRRHGGLFLAGSVSGGRIVGDLYEYQLKSEDGSALALLMDQPLDPLVEGSDQEVGIVGTIVDDPADQIAGYSGTLRRVIWVASAIQLD
jgi:hypothetical protein